MLPPEKPAKHDPLNDVGTDAGIDERYGLEPVFEPSTVDVAPVTGLAAVVVDCPYCGERFETNADASAGPCKYVEDCQVCCQPIEMELRVDEQGVFEELRARRSDG
jgi:hypothetical protein